MSLPRVSVVVTCYNYGAYLNASVGSALAQDGVDVDVTIVDDGSTDSSPQIARRWVERDERVRLIRHTQNQGHIATYNEALAEARAPYVVKLDADDILPPGALRRAAAVLDAHENVSFVYGANIQFDGAPPTPADTDTYGVKVWTGERWLWRRAHGGVNYIACPEAMSRRSALDALGWELHRKEIPEASDYHLWLRLATVGDVARINGPVQGLYRIQPRSLQRTVHAGALSDLRARVKVFDMLVAEDGDALGHPESLRRQAYTTLGREAVLHALDAFDRGTADSDDVIALAALATDLYPDVIRTPRWRELQHRLADGRAVATPWFAPTRFVRRHRWNHRVRWMRRYQR